MNRFRTHIARFVVVLLICSGFALSLVQPTQAKHTTGAFADWLSTMTKAADGAELKQELENLRHSNAHLEKVIAQASEIISKNNEEFSFSYENSMASQQLYQMLLIEWNQFQTANAMSSLPVQQIVKSLVPVKTDKSSAGNFWVSAEKGASNILSFSDRSVFPEAAVAAAIVPMAGGIAIGAP